MVSGYGVFKGTTSNYQRWTKKKGNPHFKINLKGDGDTYEVPVNVRSVDGSEVLFIHQIYNEVNTDFFKFIREQIDEGYSTITAASPASIDYVRQQHIQFDVDAMKLAPYDAPGANDDVQDPLVATFDAALNSNATVYAFGQKYSSGFGVHDIHMNQGNDGNHQRDDGIFTDGALLVDFGDHFEGFFFAFQSQSWDTDARGHAKDLDSPPVPRQDRHGDMPADFETAVAPTTSKPKVLIMSALVDPRRGGDETVKLENFTSGNVNLKGWKIAVIHEENTSFNMLGRVVLPPSGSIIASFPPNSLNAGDVISLFSPDDNENPVDTENIPDQVSTGKIYYFGSH